MITEKLTVVYKDRMLHYKIGQLSILTEVQVILQSMFVAKGAVILSVPKLTHMNYVLTESSNERVKDFVFQSLRMYSEPQVEKRVN